MANHQLGADYAEPGGNNKRAHARISCGRRLLQMASPWGIGQAATRAAGHHSAITTQQFANTCHQAKPIAVPQHTVNSNNIKNRFMGEDRGSPELGREVVKKRKQ